MWADVWAGVGRCGQVWADVWAGVCRVGAGVGRCGQVWAGRPTAWWGRKAYGLVGRAG